MFKHLIAALAAGLLCSIAAQAAPVVSLTGPANGVRYLPPAVVTLTASASDPADTIARVDFYSGTTLIGTAASAPYTLEWTDIPTGTYSVTARAVNSHNASKTSAAIRVVVNTPPKVSLRLPATGASVAGLANIDLVAEVNDADGTITKVQFYRAGTMIGTATTAPYVLTWANAPPGTYRLTARATDNLGSVITSDAMTITVTNPITVAMTTPATNTRYLPTATIPLGATATDTNGAITQVDFYAGTMLIGTATTAPYAIDWTNAPVGKHVITARATDSQGLTRTSGAIAVTVNTPPTVRLTAPLATTAYVGLATIELAANVNDADGTITKVQFYRGGTLIGTVTTPPYTLVWANAPPGTYRITARATDNLGGVITSEATTVTVTNPITVAMTAPASTRYLPPATIELSAAATAANGTITQVDFYAGTILVGSAATAPYGVHWSNVPAGSHAITAKATDSQGLTRTSAALRLVVDTAPTVVLRAPLNQARYAAPAVITLAADVADSDGSIAKVQFFNGGTLLATVTQAPYTHDWQSVARGSYTILAKATDNLGVVTTSAPVTVQVLDNVPPTVSMLATPTDATAPATVLLNAAASDADGSVARVEFFNGSTLLGSVTQAPYAYNWMNVAAGSYTITAKATDDRGAVTVSEPAAVTVTAIPAAAQVYYIDSDHLNTPRVITDASNRIVWQWDNSDPFGGNLPEEDPGNTGTRLEFNLRFPGQYFDRETGLHYNYHRTYDPNTGRYIESDTIGLQGGIYTYAYVESNPISHTDSKGLQQDYPEDRPAPVGVPNPSAAAQNDLAARLDKLFCPPDCIQLKADIEAEISNLRVRYVQLTADAGSLFCARPIGKFSWMGHLGQYYGRRIYLQRLIAKAKAQGCPYNPEADEWAQREPPYCPATWGFW